MGLHGELDIDGVNHYRVCRKATGGMPVFELPAGGLASAEPMANRCPTPADLLSMQKIRHATDYFYLLVSDNISSETYRSTNSRTGPVNLAASTDMVFAVARCRSGTGRLTA